jgi:hypothetical protein
MSKNEKEQSRALARFTDPAIREFLFKLAVKITEIDTTWESVCIAIRRTEAAVGRPSGVHTSQHKLAMRIAFLEGNRVIIRGSDATFMHTTNGLGDGSSRLSLEKFDGVTSSFISMIVSSDDSLGNNVEIFGACFMFHAVDDNTGVDRIGGSLSTTQKLAGCCTKAELGRSNGSKCKGSELHVDRKARPLSGIRLVLLCYRSRGL